MTKNTLIKNVHVGL